MFATCYSNKVVRRYCALSDGYPSEMIERITTVVISLPWLQYRTLIASATKLETVNFLSFAVFSTT